MNSPIRPPLKSIVPENAPFTPEQRTWLNGFFAGLLEGCVGADAGHRRRRRGR
jgi:sulfite reductase (NADPH) flavoprotein alpha-component